MKRGDTVEEMGERDGDELIPMADYRAFMERNKEHLIEVQKFSYRRAPRRPIWLRATYLGPLRGEHERA
jgi:hypothetical protein